MPIISDITKYVMHTFINPKYKNSDYPIYNSKTIN